MSQPPYPPASDGSGAPQDQPGRQDQPGQPGPQDQPGPYSLPPQPQAPPQGVPVEGNPYAQPAPPPPPPAYGGYQGHQGHQAHQGHPGHQGYQGAPPPYIPQPPQPPQPAQSSGGRRRAALLAGAVAAVVLLAGGGVWLAVNGADDGGDGKDVAAGADPSASASGGSEKTAAPEPSAPDPSDAEPSDAAPTGTGMEGMWRSSSGSGVLGILKGEDIETIQKDSKITMVYVKGDLECKGLRTVTEPGTKYRFALICSRDEVPVKSEDRSGDFTFGDGALSVEWTSGGTGTETFDRYADAP
ncbi:hypothetical protein [Streptomyces sp. NPDC059142]|uniref:hypothetical protein n=1 Tax=Streptomyces sp. NPDC059142 TaxID=3346739 RepID=UPI0036B8722B